MGFSRGFGTRDTPCTFAACKKMWDEASTRKLAKGYLKLGDNTELHYSGYDGGFFYATFHNSTIVKYYPEYKVIDGCGYEDSPTTQQRISALTGCWMGNDSSLGFEQRVRVSGYPYFDGMRIDNYGKVLEADQRPDYKTVTKKEVTQAYTNLFRKLERVTIGRWELGEWPDGMPLPEGSPFAALMLIEEQFAKGDMFVQHDVFAIAIRPVVVVLHKANDLRAVLKHIKETYRADYVRRNDGYETLEVKK